jgi:XTP/dITP diphosphohydrolase
MDGKVMVIATKNRHKAGELAALATGLAGAAGLADWEREHGVTLAEPPEDGETFIENALEKARHYARATGLPALADDSGLSVAALGGAPGVRSARYGGPGLDDAGRCRLLLQSLDGYRDRRAFFTSVLALARPDGAALCWTGRVDGLITREPRGAGGFGYDPIFYYPPAGQT